MTERPYVMCCTMEHSTTSGCSYMCQYTHAPLTFASPVIYSCSTVGGQPSGTLAHQGASFSWQVRVTAPSEDSTCAMLEPKVPGLGRAKMEMLFNNLSPALISKRFFKLEYIDKRTLMQPHGTAVMHRSTCIHDKASLNNILVVGQPMHREMFMNVSRNGWVSLSWRLWFSRSMCKLLSDNMNDLLQNFYVLNEVQMKRQIAGWLRVLWHWYGKYRSGGGGGEGGA